MQGSNHTDTEGIGDRLRRLRLERNLSQRDLSGPGVSYAYISRIEAGARRPSVKALRVLAQKLGVTAQYLETGSQLDDTAARELRLSDLELRLRLEGEGATRELLEVLDDAVAHADLAAVVRARVALGADAASRNAHAETIDHLGHAIASELVTAVSRPDVYLMLGHAYAAAGTPRQAVELFDEGLAELAEKAPNDVATRIRFATYLSYALTDLGELQRAKAVVTEVTAGATELVDPYTRVRLYWSLGRISIEQAKPQAALANFRRAIALLEATEDALHLGRAHLACAEAAMIDPDGLDVAEQHLAEAERLLGTPGDTDDLAVIRRMQATCAIARGNYAGGLRLAEQGLALAEEFPNEAGQSWWAIADARAGLGEASADDAFRSSIELLRLHGTVRNYANVLRAYGRFLRDAGREHDALDIFEQAANVASNLQGELTSAER